MLFRTLGLFESPRFEVRFREYEFQWLTTMPKKYSATLVQEIYATYKGEFKRQYPQGNL